MVDHVGDIRHVVGTAVGDGDVPAAAIGLQRRDHEAFARADALEAARLCLSGGVAAAGVKVEHERQTCPAAEPLRNEQAVGSRLAARRHLLLDTSNRRDGAGHGSRTGLLCQRVRRDPEGEDNGGEEVK